MRTTQMLVCKRPIVRSPILALTEVLFQNISLQQGFQLSFDVFPEKPEIRILSSLPHVYQNTDIVDSTDLTKLSEARGNVLGLQIIHFGMAMGPEVLVSELEGEAFKGLQSRRYPRVLEYVRQIVYTREMEG